MDFDWNSLTSALVATLSEGPHQEAPLKDLVEKVKEKTDMFKTLGEASNEHGTQLLQYMQEFKYPAHSFAGILFLWQQAGCLPEDRSAQLAFFFEVRRLLMSAGDVSSNVDALVICNLNEVKTGGGDSSPRKGGMASRSSSSKTNASSSSSSKSNASSSSGAAQVEGNDESEVAPMNENAAGGMVDDASDNVPNSNIYMYLSKELTAVLDKAVEAACLDPKVAIMAVEPLKLSADLLRPREGCLTSGDSCMLQACISAQYYSYAEKVLDSMTIFEIDPKLSHLDAAHYLSFFYYAGIVHMARNKYTKAIEFFEYAITAPSESCSAISLESYKKAVLVSLLEYGCGYTCPKYTSSAVKRRCNKAKEYSQIAEIYEKCDRGKMEGLLHKENIKNGLINDGNWGLVKQLYSTLQTKAMKNLTSTYIKLSLQDIAQKIGAPSKAQVEADLVRLIADGAIDGSIDQATGIVSFGAGAATSSASASRTDVTQVVEAIRESMELADKLRDIKKNVLTSEPYVKSISQGSGPGGLGGRHGLGGGLAELGDISMIDDMDMD